MAEVMLRHRTVWPPRREWELIRRSDAYGSMYRLTTPDWRVFFETVEFVYDYEAVGGSGEYTGLKLVGDDGTHKMNVDFGELPERVEMALALIASPGHTELDRRNADVNWPDDIDT